MYLEKALRTALSKALKTYGYSFKVHGSRYVKAGVPDFILCTNGLFVAIECKTPRGKLTNLQLLASEQIKASGGLWLLCQGNTVREAVQNTLNLLEDYMANKKKREEAFEELEDDDLELEDEEEDEEDEDEDDDDEEEEEPAPKKSKSKSSKKTAVKPSKKASASKGKSKAETTLEKKRVPPTRAALPKGTFSPEQAGEQLGLDGKRVRALLRQMGIAKTDGRYALTRDQIKMVKAKNVASKGKRKKDEDDE